jgi:hypothetical protein
MLQCRFHSPLPVEPYPSHPIFTRQRVPPASDPETRSVLPNPEPSFYKNTYAMVRPYIFHSNPIYDLTRALPVLRPHHVPRALLLSRDQARDHSAPLRVVTRSDTDISCAHPAPTRVTPFRPSSWAVAGGRRSGRAVPALLIDKLCSSYNML